MNGLQIFILVTLCALSVGGVLYFGISGLILWYFQQKRDYISNLINAAAKTILDKEKIENSHDEKEA